MRPVRFVVSALGALGLAAPTLSAQAQLWDPTGQKPHPTMVVAADMSVDMAEEPGSGCGGGGSCHFNSGSPNRWQVTRTNFITAMDLFKDKFAFGSFAYSGAGFAHIKVDGVDPWAGTSNPNPPGGFPHNNRSVWKPVGAANDSVIVPDVSNIPASYASVRARLNQLDPDFCQAVKGSGGCSERFFAGALPATCLTVGCNLLVENAAMEAIFTSPPNGMTLPAIPPIGSSTTCTREPFALSPGSPGFLGGCGTPAQGYPNRCIGAFSSDPTKPFGAVDPMREILHELVGSSTFYDWPRFDPNDMSGTAGEINAKICTPTDNAMAQLKDRLYTCILGGAAYLNLGPQGMYNNPGTGPTDSAGCPGAGPCAFGGAYACTPGTLQGTLCAAGSSFMTAGPGNTPTCVCGGPTPPFGGGIDPDCLGGAAPIDNCGQPLGFKARQQVAMCFAQDANPGAVPTRGPFRSSFISQPENVMNSAFLGDESKCRTNASIWLTTGYANAIQGVGITANSGPMRQVYKDHNYGSQSFVIRASNSLATNSNFGNVGNGIASPGSFAGDASALQTLFAGAAAQSRDGLTNANGSISVTQNVLNRQLVGPYAAANLGVDKFETRLAVLSFEVPAIPDYIGRPSRLSWYSLDPLTGAIGGLLWESDWASRNPPSTGVTPAYGCTGNTLGNCPVYLRPTGFWADGVTARGQTFAGGYDRDSDGVLDPPPAGSSGYSFGYMNGASSSQPVIVERPRDVPAGVDSTAFSLYQQRAVASGGPVGRPRVAYVLSGGFLHAIHAGNEAGPTSIGRTNLSFSYDDSAGSTANGGPPGRELWRYMPGWVNTPHASNAAMANAMHLPLMNGQIAVREVQTVFGVGADFKTIAVFNQGTGGPGYAAIDVTNPNSPTPLWSCPGTIGTCPGGANGNLIGAPYAPFVVGSPTAPGATAEPAIYTWPGTPQKSVLLVTTGLNQAASKIFAYTFHTSTPTLVSQVNVGGGDIVTSPVCVDTKGEGYITACFALTKDGDLWRIPVSAAGGFGGPVSMGGYGGGGREFWTRPTIYYDVDNSVNLVFGSGNPTKIDKTYGISNQVFKVRLTAAGSGTTANVCLNNASSGGIFGLGGDEHVLSPPVVSKGIVAYTTYTPGANGCVPGTAKVYAMNFSTCKDAYSGANSAAGAVIGGGGIPVSPLILRTSQHVITHTSVDPSNGSPGTTVGSTLKTTGGTKKGAIPLYYRVEQINR